MMNSHDDLTLTSALRGVFDDLAIPQVDVPRILERSSRHRRPQQTTSGVRLGALLAIAAAVVLVMIAGTQRGWALGDPANQRLAAALSQALKMLHLPMPKDAAKPTLHIDNFQYVDISRIQSALPFRLIEPAGLRKYGVVVHGETRRNGSVGVYWLTMPAPTTFHGAKAVSSDSIEVDEFAHGHAIGIPAADPQKTVSLEFDPDGTLKRAHVVALGFNDRAVRRFTIGNVDVAVIVNARNPGPIADTIRERMLARAARRP